LELARAFFNSNQPEGSKLSLAFASIGDDPSMDAWSVTYKTTPKPREQQQRSHTHCCDWCGKTYVHTHPFSGKHPQFKGQCPNTSCQSYHQGNNPTGSTQVIQATASLIQTDSVSKKKDHANLRHPGFGYQPFVKETKAPSSNIGFINKKSVDSIPIRLADQFSAKKRNAFFCLKRISQRLRAKRVSKPPHETKTSHSQVLPHNVYHDIEAKATVDRLRTSSVDLSLLSSSILWMKSIHQCNSHECIVASQTIRRAGLVHLSQSELVKLHDELTQAHYPGDIVDLIASQQVLNLQRSYSMLPSLALRGKIELSCRLFR
jgi:hypothetical protein